MELKFLYEKMLSMSPLERAVVLDNGMAFSHMSLLAITECKRMHMYTYTLAALCCDNVLYIARLASCSSPLDSEVLCFVYGFWIYKPNRLFASIEFRLCLL